ncbi:MAG: DNA-3-methyladenine glycosylase I [Candidatus Azotimanducaceae bacterium]|jgi:DNA-3-methyladenine glycosylase I
MNRCTCANHNNPLYLDYHDNEWGVPTFDDQTLFEFITLEGAQAGLSWETILNKREGYRKAFKNFDVKKVAKMTDKEVQKLLLDPSIVRNRLKVNSTVKNAQAFLTVQKEFGSFSKYIWSFVDNTPVQNKRKSMSEIPAVTELAILISKDLKKRGFSFVGPTIMYAFMQACGLVNDHTTDCFHCKQVAAKTKIVIT